VVPTEDLRPEGTPSKKIRDLVKHAQKNNAEKPVLEELKNMPEQEYKTMADVMKGFGTEH
jgi:hypothetical protein